MYNDNTNDLSSLLEDFEDFFDNSLCGYIIATAEGTVVRSNARLGEWMNVSPDQLAGKRISDLLTIGGKIYYETHLWPLLRMQGFFDEIALELAPSGRPKLPVLVNALERRDAAGIPNFIRLSIFKATDRRTYEQNLKDAKASLEKNLATSQHIALLREQFIAILGHDLRNPLGSIKAGISLLMRSELKKNDAQLAQLISRSALRMEELIGNIMDFARTRLGEGLVLSNQRTALEPVLQHVIEELRSIWTHRKMDIEVDLKEPILCDPDRIAQLLSNLVANALTHGSPSEPVRIDALHRNGIFEISVCNAGKPIPEDHIQRLFEPFTREDTRPSLNGLGLGLYICSQISKAHHGTITVTSTTVETCFTFRMPA